MRGGRKFRCVGGDYTLFRPHAFIPGKNLLYAWEWGGGGNWSYRVDGVNCNVVVSPAW